MNLIVYNFEIKIYFGQSIFLVQRKLSGLFYLSIQYPKISAWTFLYKGFNKIFFALKILNATTSIGILFNLEICII